MRKVAGLKAAQLLAVDTVSPSSHPISYFKSK
jgi:hypothetical protein